MGEVVNVFDSANERAYKRSRHTLGMEVAWEISDAIDIVREIQQNKQIILGGDVLDSNMHYTGDNWYYNPQHKLNNDINSHYSCEHAAIYLTRYVEHNGLDFYVVIVTN